MSERFTVDKDTPGFIKDINSPLLFSIYVNPNNYENGELDIPRAKKMAQFICDKLNAEWDERRDDD